MRVSVVVPKVFPAVRLGVTTEVDPRPQPGDIAPRLEPAVATTRLVVIPWSLAVTLVAALGIPVLVILWRRRPEDTDPPIGPATGRPARRPRQPSST